MELVGFLLLALVLGVEPWAFCMLSQCLTTVIHSQLSHMVYLGAPEIVEGLSSERLLTTYSDMR